MNTWLRPDALNEYSGISPEFKNIYMDSNILAQNTGLTLASQSEIFRIIP